MALDDAAPEAERVPQRLRDRTERAQALLVRAQQHPLAQAVEPHLQRCPVDRWVERDQVVRRARRPDVDHRLQDLAQVGGQVQDRRAHDVRPCQHVRQRRERAHAPQLGPQVQQPLEAAVVPAGHLLPERAHGPAR